MNVAYEDFNALGLQDALRSWFAQQGISNPYNYDNTVLVGENGPPEGDMLSADAQNLLQKLGITGLRYGDTGKETGQAVFTDAQGNALGSHDYDLGDSWQKSLGQAIALAGAAFGGLGLAGAGPLSGLGGAAGGGSAVGGATGGAAGANMLATNPALIESALGGAGYGASSAGAGGIGALQSGFHALTNPLLNSVGMSGGGNLLGSLGKLGGGGSMDWLQLGGNLLNGYMGSRAAGKAADAQTAAGQEANALQKYIFDQTRADWAPYRDAGVSALGQIQGLLKDPSSIASMPDYQFGLNEGTNALQNSASARGMTYSGQQAKALQKYGQDYAGSKLNESYNRLAGIAGIGQQATGNTQNAGANYGNAVGNTLQQMGDVRGSGYMGQAQAWNDAFGGIIDSWRRKSFYDQYFGKP